MKMGKFIKEARKASGYKQVDAADIIKKERSSYSKKENDQVPFTAEEVTLLWQSFKSKLSAEQIEQLLFKWEPLRAMTGQTYKVSQGFKTGGNIHFMPNKPVFDLSQQPEIKRYVNIICAAAQHDDLYLVYNAMIDAMRLIKKETPELVELMDPVGNSNK